MKRITAIAVLAAVVGLGCTNVDAATINCSNVVFNHAGKTNIVPAAKWQIRTYTNRTDVVMEHKVMLTAGPLQEQFHDGWGKGGSHLLVAQDGEDGVGSMEIIIAILPKSDSPITTQVSLKDSKGKDESLTIGLQCEVN